MILQATTNGAISADYTIVISFSIIGALLLILATLVSNWLINSLKDIRDSLKDLHQRVTTLEEGDIVTQIKLENTVKTVKEHDEEWERLKRENHNLQTEILHKLKVMTNGR